MTYALLESLLKELKKYEAEKGLPDLSEFSAWLYEQQHPEPAQEGINGASRRQHELDEALAAQLVELYQHARHYIKTALRDTPLKGIFDYSFLLTLEEMGDLRKSDLIHYNTVEFSPGMEVIRRLLRNELIQDYDDPTDGRSKKVRLTADGLEVLQQVRPQMSLVFQILSGNLSMREKRQTLSGLRKLNNFHHPVWEQQHGEELHVIARFDLHQKEEVEQN